jgi:4-hydroxyphenylacetate 3-monooxygenase
VKMHQGVREKLAELVCYRESINAHLTAAIELGDRSPGGLLMPNQALLATGRVVACTQLPAMMHLARDLCGGQLCVTPDAASFDAPEIGPLLQKYYRVGRFGGDDRRRLFAFARDLLNSDYPATASPSSCSPSRPPSPTSCTCTTPTTSPAPPTSSAATRA